ncbi:MAG: peptidoglycan-binding protein LysM [Bacteroidia bacterium]|nr:peptidoglycan-binding protein LysM [Bacteroidia bacterium]MBT8278073.1 peptidoglycan-binding protein LysM [Bacteroidia bacterium]NND26317.1 peptidoglycan-binding protein LysM [Flavobacteriaceae bacterium]NNK59585.1 peptidoglycan-binding protein LysM [Flavobacteriaceae bacterium]NNL33890.1 peptidoglycan-binding protein LysM [Flavobacteriaceae bacterium]
MNKGLFIYSVIPFAIFATVFFGLNTSQKIDVDKYTLAAELTHEVAEKDEDLLKAAILDLKDCYAAPRLSKSFVGFKEALAFKESRGDYFSVNTYGYLGKYQFGRGTLNVIGIFDTKDFLNNPELQEKAFIANAMRNKWVLRRDIKRFAGKRINGVLVTESGILAAAHLAGPGSVKKYLRSYGAVGFTDAYGTSIKNYMRKFSGYDTSFIKPDKNAKASRI